MKERAYAKINLCLDVAGAREDGYHELKMIMVPINFYDVLELEPSLEMEMIMDRAYLPVDDRNTIVKAIHVMQEKYGFDLNFRCTLQKHIPTRAGLAGGSADAAAAIRMINRMLKLDMSREELIEVGKAVGSDVPFCLINRPALVQGTGDKIEEFECHPDFEILLVKPRKGVSTKECFALVDTMETDHPDCERMREALMTGNYEGVVSSLGNSLEAPAVQLVSQIRNAKESLKSFGFDGVLMSGSGSTVFGITRDRKLLETAMAEMKKQKYFVRHTQILDR
ncbi:MAG: 4-(cytidine 5'-diphospho)-2-C-methyl-D-erythritol kinase [Bulleidia sp.]